MSETHTRYDAVWTDAVAAEAAALEVHQVERSYRRVLALTDDLLGKLEQRNLRGQRKLDEVVNRDLARTLTELPADARRRYPGAETVQQALDGVFLVQESLLLVLQRLVHWDRVLSSAAEDDQDADLIRRSA
jgi:hypothetical protein